MSKENAEHHSQAEQLKKIFDELQQNTANDQEALDDQYEDDHPMPKIDILNLPPRQEVHSNDNVRMRFSISKPFLRFLSVILFIVVIIFAAYFVWGDDLIIIINGLK